MIRPPVVPLAAVLLLLLPGQPPQSAGQLAPTSHPPLAVSVENLWLVPSDADRTARRNAMYAPLADGVEAFGAGDYARALTLTTRPALAASDLADYASYYKGLSELKLSRAADARATFEAIREQKPAGYLSVAAAMGAGEAAEALGDTRAALAIYESLASGTSADEDVLSRVGRTALAAGEKRKAAAAFVRVYYEYALSDAAIAASSQLESLEDEVVRPGIKADLGRAARLFGARRYSDAKSAYTALRSQVSGDDREVVELRIAESDYFLGRHKAALDALTPWLNRGARQAESRFFHLSALRELGRHDDYIRQTAALVRDFPDSSWSEESLNNLGTHYILTNEDELAAQTFTELFATFPTGTRGERAAWKAGWWAYKNGNHRETVRIFEPAAKTYPRSNYRPSYLYWAGRAHGHLGAGAQAESRLRLVFADYGNSYYGRLAILQLPKNVRTAAAAAVVPAGRGGTAADPAEPPPTTRTIQLLLANGLYDEAIDELRFAQRAWGTSPAVEATIAWAYNQKGELRRGISLMRRAYPQFLTAGGQELPTEILQVIFPLTYWDLIRKHAAARKLDPYLIAALIAQESTFDPKIRSAANAWGLMQVIPSTGRRLARSLGIRRFRTSMLTDPEINVRMGTFYFSRLVEQFGGAHFALASYNAGENRVVRWRAERPGVEQDEFIDDIPFPETQNYVKRILGTAEDYRALYGKGGAGKAIPVSRAGTRSGR